MTRAMGTIFKFLNLDFPLRDGRRHIDLQNVSMPVRKLIMLALAGVLFAAVISATSYLIAMYFR